MKTLRLSILAAFVSASGVLFAQDPSRQDYAGDLAVTKVQEGLVANAPVPSRVPIRAARDFSKTFHGRSAKWRQSNDTSIATFVADSVTTYVGYGKSGRWLYTARCFSEWLMPKDIRHEVRSLYYDYRINLVYQLAYAQNRNKVYMIYLTDMNKNKMVVRWSENGIEVVKRIK